MAELTGATPAGVVASLRRADVSPPAWAGPHGPLVARIELGVAQSRVVLEAEPGWDDPSPLRRDARAWAAVQRVASSTNRALPGAFSRILAPVWPRSHELAAHNMVRIGLGVPRGPVSVHIDRTDGPAPLRWKRALAWLQACGGRAAVDRIVALPTRTDPVGISVEGGSGRGLRAEIRVRLSQSAPLGRLGVTALDLPVFREFLRSLLGECDVTRSILTFRTGFDLSNGRLARVAVDVAAAPLGWDGDSWHDWLGRAADGLGLELGRLCGPLRSGAIVPTSVGLSVDASGDPRLRVCIAEG